MDELETYQQKSNRQTVLLFPPLPSRLRYLIHKTIEDLPELTTFSVGESCDRRVVVCHPELRAEIAEDSDFESNSNVCENNPRSREDMENLAKPKSLIPSRNRAPRRPDKPLYMPRAARERLSVQNSQGPVEHKELSNPSSSSCISSLSDSCSFCETTETTNSSSMSSQESHPSVEDRMLNYTADSSLPCPQREEQKLVLGPDEIEPFVWEETVSCFSHLALKDYEKDQEDLAAEPCTAQTEDTSIDIGDVSEEIKGHLKEAARPLGCFHRLQRWWDEDQWVDNTHALGVFSSESAALHALSICHPLLKARALAEGSKKAKGKAVRRAEFIQPVKERPRTDCAVARRMVARALGLRGRGRVPRY
ncbi:hypothetical protein Q5P01_001922 [Channa striata]|uniref:R3H domain-containing protein n=1 Tax=Channa striata TaxID=64152 RepID=A0AA88NTI2_CHASR|nr:hypothetical protein Q5P01_001922 [Channa striata]